MTHQTEEVSHAEAIREAPDIQGFFKQEDDPQARPQEPVQVGNPNSYPDAGHVGDARYYGTDRPKWVLAERYALHTPISPLTPLWQILRDAFCAGYAEGVASFASAARRCTDTLTTPDSPPAGEGIRASDPEPGWIPVRHANGLHPCRGIAFYAAERPRPGLVEGLGILRIFAPQPSDPGRPPNPPIWRAPLPSDMPECGTCHHTVSVYSQEDLDWKAVYATKANPHPNHPGAI